MSNQHPYNQQNPYQPNAPPGYQPPIEQLNQVYAPPNHQPNYPSPSYNPYPSVMPSNYPPQYPQQPPNFPLQQGNLGYPYQQEQPAAYSGMPPPPQASYPLQPTGYNSVPGPSPGFQNQNQYSELTPEQEALKKTDKHAYKLLKKQLKEEHARQFGYNEAFYKKEKKEEKDKKHKKEKKDKDKKHKK